MTRPRDHLRRGPRRAAARRRRPPPGHLLRRRHRRTRRAVGDDVRQLGRQGGLPAGRRARPRARRPLRVDLPAHWLGPVFLGAAWTAGPGRGRRRRPRRRGLRARHARGLGRRAPTSCSVLACALLPMGVRFPDAVPPGVHDVGVEIWAQPDAFTPWDPPTGDDLGDRPRRRADHPGRAVERGRRRDSRHRRRPPPVGGEPGFPTGDRHLHRAAAARRLARPGHPGRTGAARGDVRRRARDRPLPCR